MTPKEKADELMDYYWIHSGSYVDAFRTRHAKKYSLFLIEQIVSDYSDSTSPYNLSKIDFWQNVKFEIMKVGGGRF